MRPFGRTSPPDAFSRVAVFGDHAPPVPAAGAAAAEAALPAAEPPQHDCWADMTHTPITASRRRMYVTNHSQRAQDVRHQSQPAGEEVRCFDGLSQMTEPVWRQVDMTVDRQGPRQEAKSEALRIEEEMQSLTPLAMPGPQLELRWGFLGACTHLQVGGRVHRDTAPIIRCLTVWRHGETLRHNHTSEPPPPPPHLFTPPLPPSPSLSPLPLPLLSPPTHLTDTHITNTTRERRFKRL